MESRRIEWNFSQGWGTAAFITALVVACFVVAFTINRRTHTSPQNPVVPHTSETWAK